MEIDLGSIAIQAVQCCIDDIKNKCGSKGCAAVSCTWSWTPDTDTVPGSWARSKYCPNCCKCTQTNPPPKPNKPKEAQKISYPCTYDCECAKCSYIWVPPTTTKCTNTGTCVLFWDSEIQQYILGPYNNMGGTFDPCNSKCPCSLWGTVPSDRETSGLIAGECTPITTEGGWKLNSTCTFPCACDLAKPNLPPADPTKPEKIYGGCRDCVCIPCSCEYTWTPPNPCSDHNCIYNWIPDSDPFADPQNGSWILAESCPFPCECSSSLPDVVPVEPTLPDSITYPCVSPCEHSSCTFAWTPDPFSDPLTGTWIMTESCSERCQCSSSEPDFTPDNPDPSVSVFYSYPCASANPANPAITSATATKVTTIPPVLFSKNSFVSIDAADSKGYWKQTRSCSSSCLCPPMPEMPPADPSIPSYKTYDCAKNPCGDGCTWTWKPACSETVTCEVGCENGIVTTVGSCGPKCVCKGSGGITPEKFCAEVITGRETFFCLNTGEGSWVQTKFCNSNCACTAEPTWVPSEPSQETSVKGTCVTTTTTPDPCAGHNCIYNWIPDQDPFADPQNGSWMQALSCPFPCDCAGSVPDFIPVEPTLPDSITYPCVAPCEYSSCTFAWTPDPFSDPLNGTWIMVESCPERCECSISEPDFTPDNPDPSVSVFYSYPCISTTTTTTLPPVCQDPKSPCVWKCTPPKDGIGQPTWVYVSGGICPEGSCSKPPTPCQAGNENSYGCGDCIATECDPACSVECTDGIAAVTGCKSQTAGATECLCYNPNSNNDESPESYCVRIGNTKKPVAFLCKGTLV